MTAGPSDGGPDDGLDALARDLDAFFREETSPSPPDPACPPQLPDTDYRLIRLLGSGGMGAVWEAEQVSLRRRVAVKILSVPSDEFPAWRDRFVRESQIVAQLHHPGIVKVFDAGSRGETYWYAMELVEGVPLNRYAFPDLRAAVEGVREAAAALAYAHRCGVVHRDVKPANMLVDAHGHVLVADFGLAVSCGDASGTGARDGTRRYMAPERLRDGVCGPAADQYALALVLRELLAGFRPCIRVRDLQAVLDHALDDRPERRYADMDAFSDDLRRAFAYEPVVARPVSLRHRTVLWSLRHPRAAAATGMALLCACGFVAALCGGYARTEAARRLAARNARLADDALTQVFGHVSRQPPSRGDVDLLSALAPYFDELAGAGDVDREKTRQALSALGVCAFRSGDYALAERSFRALTDARRSAVDQNWLAETIRRQGRDEEARDLFRQIAEAYAASPDPEERFQAGCAYEALAGRRARRSRNADRVAAFGIFRALQLAHPDNPEYAYHALCILADEPQLAEGTGMPQTRQSVLAELSRLSDAHADRLAYGLAVVEQTSRQLKRRELAAHGWREPLRAVALRADALLGRFFSRDCVVASVLEFRGLYVSWLSAMGFADDARLERVRTETMLELLMGGEDLPAPTRGRHAFAGGTLPYRRLDVAGDGADGPVRLVLLLHARNCCGIDNTLPLSMPLLRPLVLRARRLSGRTVVLLPQCPAERKATWFGESRERPDGLLDGVADLVAATARELGVPAGQVLVAGELEGADAALAFCARRPDLVGRVLAVSAEPLPAEEAGRIRAAVRVCHAEFNRQVPRERMSASLDAVPEQARARPIFSVLKGFYRTNAPLGASAGVHLDWLFGE